MPAKSALVSKSAALHALANGACLHDASQSVTVRFSPTGIHMLGATKGLHAFLDVQLQASVFDAAPSGIFEVQAVLNRWEKALRPALQQPGSQVTFRELPSGISISTKLPSGSVFADKILNDTESEMAKQTNLPDLTKDPGVDGLVPSELHMVALHAQDAPGLESFKLAVVAEGLSVDAQPSHVEKSAVLRGKPKGSGGATFLADTTVLELGRLSAGGIGVTQLDVRLRKAGPIQATYRVPDGFIQYWLAPYNSD